MDVNGDGKMDMVIGPDPNNGNWYVMRSTGTAFVNYGNRIPGGAYKSFATDTYGRRYPMDVNGDGKTDLLIGPDGSGNWSVLTVHGTAIHQPPKCGAGGRRLLKLCSATTDYGRYVMDANGDGKPDTALRSGLATGDALWNTSSSACRISSGMSRMAWGALHHPAIRHRRGKRRMSLLSPKRYSPQRPRTAAETRRRRAILTRRGTALTASSVDIRARPAHCLAFRTRPRTPRYIDVSARLCLRY